VVGLTVVALGTSLPELVTAAVASYKGETDLASGNLMGSNIFNILSILGITAIITPIHVNDLILNKDIIWMLMITLMILPLMVVRRNVGRADGVVLFIVYAIYLYTVVA
jgi:cation:H+ antiporter